MIVKKIKLENIRSYLHEEVEFPEGSVLLSGDVGSGKSSVLLAIDFALFGLTRGILSGGSILRNGANEGSVELYLNVNGKDVVIKRILKRSDKSVTQDYGYILINGHKQEGSAVEIKAKVLELLKYPKDLLTKSKSLIYRFTVYTPQEEMKRILLEDSEERLEILRRVFDIDKYKRIKENSIILNKKLKDIIKEGEIRVLGLEDKKNEKLKIEKELDSYKVLLFEIINDLDKIKLNISSTKTKLSEYEDKIKKLNEAKNKLNLTVNNIQYRNNEKKKIESEINKLNNEILDNDKLKLDLDFEINSLNKLKEVESNITEKEEKLNKIRNKLSEFRLIVKNSKEMVDKVKELKNCPTCYQTVSDEHKKRISDEANEKLEIGNKNIELFKKNEDELAKEISSLKNELNKLRNDINEYKILKVKLEALKDKRSLKEKYETELSSVLDAIGELNEDKRNIEFEVDSLKKVEEEYNTEKEKLEDFDEDKRELQIKKASYEEKIKNSEDMIKRLESEIIDKERIMERKEKLNLLLKWINEQFLDMVEKMERSIMFRLHNDFNNLFQKWVSILIDNENLSVKLDNEFTPRIIQDSYDTEYEFLSGGEKTAIALAYRLSLNQVINNLMSLIETKDVIILDEPTDGFSSEQLDRVRIVLDELNIKQVIIVSHEEKIESFVDSVLRFEKKGHVSKIVR